MTSIDIPANGSAKHTCVEDKLSSLKKSCNTSSDKPNQAES